MRITRTIINWLAVVRILMFIVLIMKFVNKTWGVPERGGSGCARYVEGSVDDSVRWDSSFDLVGNDAHANRQNGEQR